MTLSLLESRDVSKIYQMGSTTVAALDHVSLAVNEGEFVAIQGTSGSGKSTLLNVLGGLDQPTTGEVLFDSKSLAPLNKREMARYRRYSVGMIFQNFNLITTMGGEQQRVAIARALANRPRVLLADEPTGNLDSTRAHELLALLREMVASDALTILLVTHDHELARTFADRIILMKDGRVIPNHERGTMNTE